MGSSPPPPPPPNPPKKKKKKKKKKPPPPKKKKKNPPPPPTPPPPPKKKKKTPATPPPPPPPKKHKKKKPKKKKKKKKKKIGKAEGLFRGLLRRAGRLTSYRASSSESLPARGRRCGSHSLSSECDEQVRQHTAHVSLRGGLPIGTQGSGQEVGGGPRTRHDNRNEHGDDREDGEG